MPYLRAIGLLYNKSCYHGLRFHHRYRPHLSLVWFPSGTSCFPLRAFASCSASFYIHLAWLGVLSTNQSPNIPAFPSSKSVLQSCNTNTNKPVSLKSWNYNHIYIEPKSISKAVYSTLGGMAGNTSIYGVLPDIVRLSNNVIRIMGGNPGKVSFSFLLCFAQLYICIRRF